MTREVITFNSGEQFAAYAGSTEQRVSRVTFGSTTVEGDFRPVKQPINKAERMKPANRNMRAPFPGERRVTGSFGAWDRMVAAQTPVKK